MNPAANTARLRFLAGTLLLAAFALLPVHAQDAAGAAVAAAPVADAVKKTLWERIMGGGPAFMWTLILTSVFMVWLIIDNILRSRPARLAPPAEDAQLRELIGAGYYADALAYCQLGSTPLLHVVGAGLSQVGKGHEAAEQAVIDELDSQKSAAMSRISYLSVIGVVTPMIGLTGTVFGMIKAFDTLGQAGVGDPGKLSAAIGTVLVATAGGLVVAIPAFTAYYVLRNLIAKGFKHLERASLRYFRNMPYDQLAGVRLGEGDFVPGAPTERVA